MSEPQTDAGRLLLDWLDFVREKRGMAGVPRWDAVANIEREAVAAYLASPEAAEALAGALTTLDPDTGQDDWQLIHVSQADTYETSRKEWAAAILAAWRKRLR